MQNSTSELDDLIPDGQIDLDLMDRYCRHLPIHTFNEVCQSLSYRQLCQVQYELSQRASRIKSQIDSSHINDVDWRKRSNSAYLILQHKRLIVSNRIDTIRNNNISSLVDKFGSLSNVQSNRLLLIKCLLSIIDNYSSINKLPDLERSVIDSCRVLSSSQTYEPKFDDFSYNPVTGKVVSDNSIEIASLSPMGYRTEENGYLLAASFKMLDVLTRIEPFLDPHDSPELRLEVSSLIAELR
jgi:hypothetical protein